MRASIAIASLCAVLASASPIVKKGLTQDGPVDGECADKEVDGVNGVVGITYPAGPYAPQPPVYEAPGYYPPGQDNTPTHTTTYPPAAPAVEPPAPTTEPQAPAAEPAAEPAAPAVEPPAPTVEPQAPAVEPAAEPAAPAVEPPAPTTQPQAPAAEPAAPAVEPPAPTVEPQAPAVEPAAEPAAPAVEPAAPAVEPPAPTTQPPAAPAAEPTIKAAAQTTTQTTPVANDALTAHNDARAKHKATPMTWNQTLADYALQEGSCTKFAHDLTRGGGHYGQNIAVAGNTAAGAYTIEVALANAIKEWYDEESLYTNLYGQANPPQSVGDFLHFTQMVWQGSNELGCAVKTCGTDNSIYPGMYVWYTVCNYYPPGNVLGTFDKNVLP